MLQRAAHLLNARWSIVPDHRPVLVTGSHRSGTTWVAAVLSKSGEAKMVDEAFNLDYCPRRVVHHFPQWFQYICDDNETAYSADLTAHMRSGTPWVNLSNCAQPASSATFVGSSSTQQSVVTAIRV